MFCNSGDQKSNVRLFNNLTVHFAQKGNLEARYAIYDALFKEGFSYKGEALYIISYEKMRSILYFHSLGSPTLSSTIERMKRVIGITPSLRVTQYPEFSSIYGYNNIRQCILDDHSQACTAMLIQQALIVPFSSLEAQINMILAAGAEPPFINPNNPNTAALR